MTPEERIKCAIECLRSCYRSTIADVQRFGPNDHLTVMQEARADAYQFAISLLDPESAEAKEWKEKIERTRKETAWMDSEQGANPR